MLLLLFFFFWEGRGFITITYEKELKYLLIKLVDAQLSQHAKNLEKSKFPHELKSLGKKKKKKLGEIVSSQKKKKKSEAQIIWLQHKYA